MIYTFQAPDPSSDRGRALVIIQTETQGEAVKRLRDHLRRRERLDLLEGFALMKSQPDGTLLYSDVEIRSGY